MNGNLNEYFFNLVLDFKFISLFKCSQFAEFIILNFTGQNLFTS
jgi:hypothetical protein